jgi:hypothetical protein
MDSFDFKMRKPEQVRQSVMEKLKKHGKGIVLVHDFQHATAEAAMDLLKHRALQLLQDGLVVRGHDCLLRRGHPEAIEGPDVTVDGRALSVEIGHPAVLQIGPQAAVVLAEELAGYMKLHSK